MSTYESLPSDLPAPVDDGAADHLVGGEMPSVSFKSTSTSPVDLSQTVGGSVIYIYPKTGRPDQPMPEGWEAIPGARGCTPEACNFRDHHADLAELGTDVFGFSCQTTDYQAEMAERLHLPFPILSDPGFALADALGLPTFEAFGERLYTRLSLFVTDGVIEHVWYPIFPPDRHASAVVDWLSSRT